VNGGVSSSRTARAKASAPRWMPGDGFKRPVAKRSTFIGMLKTSFAAPKNALRMMPMNFGPGSTRWMRQTWVKRSTSMIPRVPRTTRRFSIGRAFHDSSRRPTPVALCACACHSSKPRFGSVPRDW
jgi:hypothetical protein